MIVRREAFEFNALPGRDSADPFANVKDANLSMRIVDIPPGDRNPHVHPHSHEAMYVLGGTGTLWEDGKTERVKAGDAILIPPNTPHATIADPDAPLRLACFFPRGDLASNIQEIEGNIVLDRGESK
jgi:quercetin dioxygenase-like cupin family protein